VMMRFSDAFARRHRRVDAGTDHRSRHYVSIVIAGTMQMSFQSRRDTNVIYLRLI